VFEASSPPSSTLSWGKQQADDLKRMPHEFIVKANLVPVLKKVVSTNFTIDVLSLSMAASHILKK
jgi:hypothetical protein